jgi:hypothetical protein
VCIFASLSATSFASEPVLRRITFSSGAGTTEAKRSASAKHGFREHPRVQVDDLVERLPDRGGDPRVVVPERRADLAGGEVQHPSSVGCLDPRPLGARDDEGGEAAGVPDEEALAGVGHGSSLSCDGRQPGAAGPFLLALSAVPSNRSWRPMKAVRLGQS